MATAVALSPPAAELAEVLRSFHCHGCGRRLFQYTPAGFGAEARIVWRCRDCKTPNALRGADVVALLGALSQGRG